MNVNKEGQVHRICYAINKEKGCGDNPRSPKEHDSEVVRQKTLESCVKICILLYINKMGCRRFGELRKWEKGLMWSDTTGGHAILIKVKKTADFIRNQPFLLVRVGRFELPASWTQIKRPTNWATPGYEIREFFAKWSNMWSKVILDRGFWKVKGEKC